MKFFPICMSAHARFNYYEVHHTKSLEYSFLSVCRSKILKFHLRSPRGFGESKSCVHDLDYCLLCQLAIDNMQPIIVIT